MSDRMLSDEILLGIINSKSGGGGGGGTGDYNDLKNQPQINGNTLIGNKTASDLGLVAAVNGKGLSTNDYTNADKAIVGGVTAALANKQDATDNSLQTTDKTVVGAINEHEGDIDSLKSGLIDVNTALNAPNNSGKNLFLLTIGDLKRFNATGTWADNVYTVAAVAFTVNADSAGNITSISANGTATGGEAKFYLAGKPEIVPYAGKALVVNGCTGGSNTTYMIQINKYNGTNQAYSYNGDSNEFIPTASANYGAIVIRENVAVTNQVFYPMMRFADITDPTFAPYIPSVESRIEAVESGMINVRRVTSTTTIYGDISKPSDIAFDKIVGLYVDGYMKYAVRTNDSIKIYQMNNSSLTADSAKVVAETEVTLVIMYVN